MDEEVHALHVAIVGIIVVTTRIVVDHYGLLAVGTHLGDKGEHIVAEAAKHALWISGAMNTLVAQRQTDHHIVAEVAQQVIIAVEQIGGGVAADGHAGGKERILAVAVGMAVLELLTVEICVALEAVGTLTVGHRGAEYAHFVGIHIGGNVESALSHVEGYLILAPVDADILSVEAERRHHGLVGAGHTLDSQIIIIVEGKPDVAVDILYDVVVDQFH